MFFQILSEDQDIVQINNYDVLYYKIIENVIHHCLECHWVIGYAKKYYQELKKFMISEVAFYSRLDVDIVKISANIQFGKILSILKLQNK